MKIARRYKKGYSLPHPVMIWTTCSHGLKVNFVDIWGDNKETPGCCNEFTIGTKVFRG